MGNQRLQYVFFLVITVIAFVLFFVIIRPYVSVLVLAGSLAIIFHPLYRQFQHLTHNEGVAATVTVFLVALIVFIPLTFLAVRVSNEVPQIYASLSGNGGFDFVSQINGALQKNFPRLPLPKINLTVNVIANEGITWFSDNIGTVFSSVGQILFDAFLSLVGLFYFLKDGERLKRWVARTMPLSPNYEKEIFSEVRSILAGVIRGTILTAIIQGIVVGIGFMVFGIPDPAFWGILVAVFSPIPIIGTWIIVVPAIAFLLLTNATAAAIGLAVWCLVFVNVIYNLITPQLMHHGNEIHPFIILISILGGIAFFGPIGFLTGPLVAALAASLLTLYPHIMAARNN